ncbi:alpha/beta fold hydrolase [Krasilnikovia sp. M28-CT-15]|uniref:S9 family peptidase n=1 Tax=Krasilnikovia sp. M28-CT-15 TaxID=3373540 RepID=UPI00399C9599
MIDVLPPSWELLDADTDGAAPALLAVRHADNGSQVFVRAGRRSACIATFADETVRGGTLRHRRGRAFVVVEDAKGGQRVVRAVRDDRGWWRSDGDLPLPGGAVLDLDIDAGILLAVASTNAGAVDVFRFDAYGANRTEVYRGGGWIFNGSLSPDGTNAALLRVADGKLDTELVVCAVGSPEAPLELIAHAAPAAMGVPCWSPDGGTLLICTNVDREFARIVSVDVQTGIWKELWAAEHDMDVRLANDTPLLWHNVEGQSRITRPDLDGAAYRLPEQGVVRTPRRPVIDREGRLYCTFSSPRSPAAVWRLSTDAPPELLTPERHAEELGKPWRSTVVAPDLVRVPALVWPGKPHGGAAVVILHGGPEEQWRWDHYPLISALRRLGVTVVTPDLRGSVGFGKRYYGLDDGVRHVDAQLDLDAVHGSLARLGLDPANAALVGYSFGGYQALLGLTSGGSAWSAAVVVSGVSDPLSYLAATSPHRRPHRELTYGSLAHDREFLQRVSPACNAAAVRVPLLLVHGELDPIVPVGQANRMAELVRAAGGDVQLKIMRGEGHQFRRASSQAALISWVTEFLQTSGGGAR